MPFPVPVVEASYLGRPQRFLAAVRLAGGEELLVYCANPGASERHVPLGAPCLLWDSGNERRRRRFTWKAVRLGNTWIGVDTHFANKVVAEALSADALPGFRAVSAFSREVQLEPGIRADFAIRDSEGDCIIEVKSVAVVSEGIARFPDSRTPRGIAQLQALLRRQKAGCRTALLYLVQRHDATALTINASCDPCYASLVTEIRTSGASVSAVRTSVGINGITIVDTIPILWT